MVLLDIHYLELQEVAQLIHSRELTSVVVTNVLLERITAECRHLNAYIEITAKHALEQAKAADAELVAGIVRGPLHGVPIAVKDICDMAGFVTTAAMPLRRKSTAASDATVIRKLKDSGAIILGKLNLAEGAWAEHRLPYGPPINPWDHERWPGVSSSGSGVAVAAGLCYAALASDTGSSIRTPAAANGVTGLKPTWGRVSRHGVFELAASLDHVGPMARSAVDVGIMLSVIAGYDRADPTSSCAPVPNYVSGLEASVAGMKIGVDREWVSDGVDQQTIETLFLALDILSSLGAQVVDIDFPDTSEIVWDWGYLCAAQTAYAHRDTYPAQKDNYGPALTSLLDIGNAMSALNYQKIILRREDFASKVQAIFRDIDLLACPVLAFPVPTVEQMKRADDNMIQGLRHFTCPFTMARNPTITMPGGYTDDGMPIAIQLVAPHFREDLLVRAGYAFQSATDWHRRRPVSIHVTAPRSVRQGGP